MTFPEGVLHLKRIYKAVAGTGATLQVPNLKTTRKEQARTKKKKIAVVT